VDSLDGVEIVAFPDAAAWEAWLEANHGRSSGVWLELAKQGSGVPSVTSDQAVDVGLCWGWVSGKRRSLDDHWFLQKYVPRRARSLWSRVNVDKVQQLLAAGRMREPGMAEVRAAQADGRWDAAYDSQRDAAAPPDVVAALAANERALAAFESLGSTARYRAYLPVLQARRPKVRAARLRRMIEALEAPAPPDRARRRR
jgi:uncharacterized protein YdeI (YjbR/CyaY-like superfamily)